MKSQLGAKLEASMKQISFKFDGSRTVLRPQKWKFWPSLGGHLGGQNRSKIEFEAILKVMFFDIFSWIDFWRHLEPAWGHLGPTWVQLEPNLRPTWHQLEPTWGQLDPTRSDLKHTAGDLKNRENPVVFKRYFHVSAAPTYLQNHRFLIKIRSFFEQNFNWIQLEPTWGQLEPTWANMRPTWGQLEPT